IAASAVATDAMALHSRESLVTIGSAKAAAEKAYQQAGVGPGDIDLAEVHDCFTISEICLVEDLGFTEKGKGGEFTEAGATALDGRIPVNTSGGLKSKGHPVGATGVAQAIEVYKQLRGEAGKRQVKGAKRGLCHNMGGSGGTSAVHILEVM
ncbi:MAG TPA: thiolase domain-containing protein, partial [Planctomycetes bacterium]|nr:thiolase domain-containing protein [Planctomycetota bacterium]